jgi:hypothetical protein
VTSEDHAIPVAIRTDSPSLQFAVDELDDALDSGVAVHDVGDVSINDVALAVGTADDLKSLGADGAGAPSDLNSEGFRITREDGATIVASPADVGAMYGALEVTERARTGEPIKEIGETTSEPEVSFRAIKFNLPWSPYRGGDQTEIHYDTCRDLSFWEEFLDMMARNRFNALTLWNLHPFPFMIRAEDYPEACPFDDEELADWREFWHELFEMAHDRGIKTYILNWNIVVSPEFTEAYGVDERNDESDVIIDYTRQSVRQVVDEYPNLDGFGVSLCDWMENMTPREKEEWMLDSIVAGIEDASRSVEFLHRSVLTGSIEEMRRGIDETAESDNISNVLVPTKFNWSHGHSTTHLELTHDYHSGKVDDRLWNPEPDNYSIAWMIRNEDFFVLRWGDPDFVREHLAANHAENNYVDGYFVGSEAFIPAKDFSHRTHRHQTWEYAFEKQWLLYMVWGRLLYDPDTPDAVFEQAFDDRYEPPVGDELIEAYELASQVPEELASFHAGTWDYTLYSEGFLAPSESLGLDEVASPFISINEFIEHETLDSRYVSIPDYVAGEDGGEEAVTPSELADRVENIGDRMLELVDRIESELGAAPGALACEVLDLRAWAHLAHYFAAKLRAGVALETYRNGNGDPESREEAIKILEGAVGDWDAVVKATEGHYQEIPYATDWREGETFSWAKYRDQVERDVLVAKRERRG